MVHTYLQYSYHHKLTLMFWCVSSSNVFSNELQADACKPTLSQVFHWLSNESQSQLTNFQNQFSSSQILQNGQNYRTFILDMSHGQLESKSIIHYVSQRVYWPLGCTGNQLHASLRYLGSGLCFGKTHSKLKLQVAQDPCCMLQTREYLWECS